MQLTATRKPAVTYLPGREPVDARHARHQVRALLEAWDLSEHADLGELIASELVTNAVCHGAGPIWMQLSFARGDLRVEVHDDGAGRLVRKHVGGDDECGRGLQLLDGLIQLHGGERGVINDQAGPARPSMSCCRWRPPRQVHGEQHTRSQDTPHGAAAPSAARPGTAAVG